MALPAGWPPRISSRPSIRFFIAGTGTADFADNAYLFSGQASANPYTPLPVVQPGSNAVVNIGSGPQGTGIADAGDPVKMIWADTIRICNDGDGTLEFSFDGTNVHGQLLTGEKVIYRNRHEGGIAIRGNTFAFRVEAW